MPSDYLAYVVLAIAGFFLVRGLILARPSAEPAQARAEVAAGTAVIVDVREPPEWIAGVAQGAALLPLSDLRGGRRQWGPFLAKNRGKKLYLYCHSGTRSGVAVRLLAGDGFAAANLGGFSRWEAAGLPVRRKS